MASSVASLVSPHICRITIEPSSVYKNRKLYAYWLYDFFISLHIFHFWWPNAHKSSLTLQFMALSFNWCLNSWCDCLTSGKCCMSKHSCSYFIIVPWDNIQKRLLLSICFLCREGSDESVHLHRLTWVFVLVLKYHVLAQITIYVPFIRTVSAVVRLHQQTWHIWATIFALYQCVKNTPSAL